jgi:hypothetical protein
MRISILVTAGVARSGTTFVERAVASLPGVLGVGEPFHEDADLRTVLAPPSLRSWVRGECPRRWLSAIPRKDKILSLKLLAGQLSPPDTTDVLRIGYTIVCERHPLVCLISESQARASGVWNKMADGRGMFGTPEGAYDPRPAVLARDVIDPYLDRYRKFYRQCQGLTWRIRFREIVEDPAGVCDRLGRWLGTDAPQPVTERMNPAPIAERVANWDQIQRWYPLPEYRHLEEW